MKKKDARKIYRDKRNALTIAERSKLDDLLLINFQSVELPFLHTVLSYWPIEENKEPDTHLLTEYLRFRNPDIRIAYPVSDFATASMSAIAVDSDTAFIKTEKNIYEPKNGDAIPASEIDIVLVPLLTFDEKGYRVGYGKGFYDKYLTNCREDCILAGFSYFEPVDSLEDCDEFDVPLNLCITPQNVYVF